jgi:hypothetical protein
VLDQGVDFDPVVDDRRDDRTGELDRDGIAFRLGGMAFEDRARRPLAEVGLEDRRQRQTAAGSERADSLSCRHRPRAP